MFVYEDDAEDDSTFATPTWALKIWPRLFHNRAIFIVACSLLGAVVFLAATALLISRHTAGNIHLRNAITFSNGTTFDKHRDMRFVGLVFFGRRQFADILDCHLRRNLAVNGGLLDEVRWVMHTKNETDRQWLQNLVREQGLQEQYTLQFEDTSKEGWTRFGAGFRWIWSTMTDENTIYIKVSRATSQTTCSDRRPS